MNAIVLAPTAAKLVVAPAVPATAKQQADKSRLSLASSYLWVKNKW
jgi:hypothetical protein